MIPEGWTEEEDFLTKIFTFESFIDAVGFVNQIVPLAEELNHHPDIEINFKKVKIKLKTHSEDKITEKDKQLAKNIDSLYT